MLEIESDNQLESKLTDRRSVVLKFYATWCGPCKSVAKLVEGLATQYTEVNFFSVDADVAEDLVERYSVNSLPTIVTIGPDGDMIKKVTGASEQTITAAVKELAELADL